MARRTVPPPLERLPEQFFSGVLAAAARERERPGPPVIDLGRGNPDLPPPPHALAALQAASAQGGVAIHGYPPFQGTPALREALAARYRDDHGVELDPETEIAILPGTKTGIMLVVLAAAGAGETVLLPDPGYPDYRSATALAGVREVPLGLRADAGWQPDLDAAPDAALTVLNYPSNPCGVCAAPGTFEAAVARAHATGGWLLNDFAYGFLAFDGRRAQSLLAVEGAREVGVELWSASKVYGMAGWRAGALVGNAELVGRVKALVDHTSCGVFGAVQAGLLAALESDQADVAERVATYRRGGTAWWPRCRVRGRSSPRPRAPSSPGGARRPGSPRSACWPSSASRPRRGRASARAAPGGCGSRSPCRTRSSTRASRAWWPHWGERRAPERRTAPCRMPSCSRCG